MGLLNLNETPSQKASVVELAEVFESASSPMTLPDALMKLNVFDPGRQRSLSAAFLKECRKGGKFAHLIGAKVRPSTTARGRVSSVFEGISPLTPKTDLVRRSDAFQGIRAIDRSSYSPDLRAELDGVAELNLTGRAGVAVNQLAVEYDHALELQAVKLDNLTLLAEERRKMVEELMQVLNRVTGGSEADGGGNGRRIRSGSLSEAAE
ncbi:hypothetical protein [Mesorhizobium sp. M00.F.Ca.ET.217.01.1.1]|uniref:hypothetical protein n=1 Tax=Mesorhizobium sp. M00.F.Ca.ET.217.01.1.1 TaxID=2500529 RepID=UPI000FDA984C|nr:hypothetical protein [Mesorhizobium sp. M00.F.Ca.ET.217.01.1.1]TGQ20048.1 hypothetical protein EN860_014970 [Mesorhizobium sp. M00.F.Ca.ET.217.01.1.1]TGV94499.1 hypothetical protein EN801_002390 [Mesorhizobium sp. M00.F.Ca.ET.158.01.1.1]